MMMLRIRNTIIRVHDILCMRDLCFAKLFEATQTSELKLLAHLAILEPPTVDSFLAQSKQVAMRKMS